MAGERAGLPKDAPGNEILARVWLCLGMKWSLNGGIQNTNMKQPPQWRAHRRPSARASFDSMPSARAWPLRGRDSGFWRPRNNQTLGSLAECPKWLYKNRAFFQHQSGVQPVQLAPEPSADAAAPPEYIPEAQQWRVSARDCQKMRL